MANQKMTVQDSIHNSMVDVFTRASSAEVSGIENIEKKDGSLIPSKEYVFRNPIGKRTSMKTFDKSAIESIEKINLAMFGKGVLEFAICRELSKLNSREKLDSMGFKNIGEFADAMFDISRVTATQYARIGELFIGDDYQVSSTVLPKGLKKGHLIEFLKYVGEDGDISAIEELYLDGTLTDGMSTKGLRVTLKHWAKGELAIETDATEISAIEDKKSEGGENVSRETSKSGKSEKSEVSGDFDAQVEVGKILSACNDITAAFDALNNHGFSLMGYDKNIDQIKALAKAVLEG